ncbi:MAG: Holliday junction branch migration protein RuvA [Clostridium sp.]|jgi:Holliday junction DNA helicase RuvA|nr:Holliday junction branch migration protein RuvA [Clostridium sp.]
MIAFLVGAVREIAQDNVILEVNHIGYHVKVSSDTAARLSGMGEDVRLHTYTYVREDTLCLYGFLSKGDLEIFKKCIMVSGIGPKVALALLSAMDGESLRFAILSGDVKAIAKAPGIGKKTAERLILDLKDKLSADDVFPRHGAGAADGGGIQADSVQKKEAIEALVALGYGQTEAAKAVNAITDIEEMETGAVLKAALKKMI